MDKNKIELKIISPSRNDDYKFLFKNKKIKMAFNYIKKIKFV